MPKKLFATILILFILPLAALPVGAYAADSSAPTEDISSEEFMFTLEGITHEGITGSVKQNWLRQGVNYLLERAISIMAAVIGTASILVMSFGGFLMLSSAGNETLYEKGKSYIKYSAIGLAVTLGAYVLVTSVQLLIKSIWS